MGLGSAFVSRVADGLEKLAVARPPVLWLQAQSCTGCSVSLLNTHSPTVPQLLTDYIRLLFHPNLGAATGGVAVDALNKAIEQGGYYLVVEGSVPRAMPSACLIGGEPAYRVIERAAVRAAAAVAVGTCAAYGGVPAAEGNPTGAVSAASFLKRRGPDLPVISLPGCPTHPDWFVGTLVHAVEFGIPELDAQGRPVMYFGKTIHEQCPRFGGLPGAPMEQWNQRVCASRRAMHRVRRQDLRHAQKDPVLHGGGFREWAQNSDAGLLARKGPSAGESAPCARSPRLNGDVLRRNLLF
jgi:hydrogenase small subunit